MGRREEQRKLKLRVLSRIKEKRNILFGRPSATNTKEMKQLAWQEVCAYAKAIGALGQDKDYKYLRDVWLPNVRKSTMEKVDNAKKTGVSAGDNSKITEVDELILTLIGKDTLVNGMRRESESQEDTVNQLKKKKLELIVENLEKESYIKSLQILKMERELELPSSKFTLSFIQDQGYIYISTEDDCEQQQNDVSGIDTESGTQECLTGCLATTADPMSALSKPSELTTESKVSPTETSTSTADKASSSLTPTQRRILVDKGESGSHCQNKSNVLEMLITESEIVPHCEKSSNA